MSTRRQGGGSRGLADALRAAERLVEALERRGVRVEAAYLFGSRVRGDWLVSSDVDLVIVSPGFRGLRYLERLDLVERVQWEEGIAPHVEAVPLTPEELAERLRGSAVLRDASRYWVRVR
ncbi:MAG: nucleotidyltransferase domain-containing protein [Desulfurococcales archaeon]|nr:nucleotidyltransferase domain-containing protein [Desulfurococcales archaeon]